MEQWLKAGGDPNAVHKSLKGTALQAAARGDHVECLEVGCPARVAVQLTIRKLRSTSLNASHAREHHKTRLTAHQLMCSAKPAIALLAANLSLAAAAAQWRRCQPGDRGRHGAACSRQPLLPPCRPSAASLVSGRHSLY